MVSLAAVLAAATRGGGALSAEIPEGWRQGRTTYGGLSAMLALEAAKGVADDLPSLRSASIAFVGPLSGEVKARAALLRRGRSASFVDVTVSGDGGIGLKACFVFVADRESSIRHDGIAMPEAVDPETAAVAMRSGGGPALAANFEWRHASPERRRAGPELLFWIRLREPGGLDPATELLAIADALPPGAITLMTERKPISSVTWLVNLLVPEPATTDGWWLMRTATHHAADGLSSEHMSMWNRDGVCVAEAMQSVAIF